MAGNQQNTGSSGDDARQSIPPRSFGNCRWCATRDVRLQYLMCTKCFRIADMIPSKIQVLLSRPEVKKRLRDGGTTVTNVVPELRVFVTDSKRRFPSERGDQEHWEVMLKEARGFGSEADVLKRAEDLKGQGVEVPTREEVKETIGLERLLHFILKIAVLCQKLKFEHDENEDGFCVVCWKDTPSEKHMLCTQCRDELVREVQPEETLIEDAPKVRKGMATSDIILKDRRR